MLLILAGDKPRATVDSITIDIWGVTLYLHMQHLSDCTDICSADCRELFIREKDALVGLAQEAGLEYVRTAGEYGHMLKDVKSGMAMYLSGTLRTDNALASQVCVELNRSALSLHCTIQCRIAVPSLRCQHYYACWTADNFVVINGCVV